MFFIFRSSFSQGHSDFENGTLDGWSNTDGLTVLLTNEEIENPEFGTRMLQKTCDGTNTSVGEMSIITSSGEWIGKYVGVDGNPFNGLAIELLLKNENDFDINIRLGFQGIDGTKMVTTNTQSVPALSDWVSIEFYLDYSINIEIISGESSAEEVFEDVQEFRIINNQAISYDGEIVEGTLQLNYISHSFLLNQVDNTQLGSQNLFPNPAKNIITLKLNETDEGIVHFYNVLGALVFSEKINDIITLIDVSSLDDGVYFAVIKLRNSIHTKKIIKN